MTGFGCQQRSDANLPGFLRQNHPSTSRLPAASLNKKDLVAGIKFGSRRWNKLTYEQAVATVEAYRKAEMDACQRLVNKINKDYWMTSFWSEVLGGASPPIHSLWIKPYYSLQSGIGAYRGGNLSAARHHLLSAISQFNEVHKKWVAYRDRLNRGGENAITIMEGTILILSTAAGGVGKSLLAKGGVAAAMAGGSATAKSLGMVAQGVEKKIDFYTIVTESAMAFVTSIAGGKLAQKFLSSIQPAFWRKVLADPKLVDAYRRAGQMLPSPTKLQAYFADFLASGLTSVSGELLKSAILNAGRKAKSKEMTMADFLKLVAIELGKDRFAKHFGERVGQLVLSGKS